jgi:hypothetical protein
MIERATNTDFNKGFMLWLTAGNDTARPQDYRSASGKASTSSKTLCHSCRVCQNPLRLAHHAHSARCQRRAQPPARNTNPHSARSTA